MLVPAEQAQPHFLFSGFLGEVSACQLPTWALANDCTAAFGGPALQVQRLQLQSFFRQAETKGVN